MFDEKYLFLVPASQTHMKKEKITIFYYKKDEDTEG